MAMKNGFVKELDSKMLNAVGNFAKASSFVTGRSYNRTPGDCSHARTKAL